MSKQVHYHQHGRDPIVLHVVAEHDNGTVDLARESDGKAIIEGIAISEEPGDGKAVLLDTEARPKRARKAKPAADAKEETPQGIDTEAEQEDEAEPSTPAGDGNPSPPPDE